MTLPTTTLSLGRLPAASGPPGTAVGSRAIWMTMPSPPPHSAPVQSNTVRPRITLWTISQRSPAVLVMPWTVPRITLRSTRTWLANVAMMATPSGSRLSAEMPRPSNTKPSMCVPLAPLTPSAPGSWKPARTPLDRAGPSAQPMIVARPWPSSVTCRSTRAPQWRPGRDVDDVARARRVDRRLDRRVAAGDPPDLRRRRLRQRREHRHRRCSLRAFAPHRSSRRSSWLLASRLAVLTHLRRPTGRDHRNVSGPGRGARVAGLVHAQHASTRQADLREQPRTIVPARRARDPLRAHPRP